MAKKYTPPQNIEALVRGGLTPSQASLYETLVQHGQLNARRASFIASVPRTLGYKVLGELEALDLVVKKDAPGKVAQFLAANPLKLKEIAHQRLEEAQVAKASLEEAAHKLEQDFNQSEATFNLFVLKSPKNVDIKGFSSILASHQAELIALSPAAEAAVTKLLSKS